MKCIYWLLIYRGLKRRIQWCIQGVPTEFLRRVIWLSFHPDCRRVPNDMVVNYVLYWNRVINMYFHRHAMYQPGIIKFFQIGLKCSISKTVRCFWLILWNKAAVNIRKMFVIQKHLYKVQTPCVSVTMDVHLHPGINYAIFKSTRMKRGINEERQLLWHGSKAKNRQTL